MKRFVLILLLITVITGCSTNSALNAVTNNYVVLNQKFVSSSVDNSDDRYIKSSKISVSFSDGKAIHKYNIGSLTLDAVHQLFSTARAVNSTEPLMFDLVVNKNNNYIVSVYLSKSRIAAQKK